MAAIETVVLGTLSAVSGNAAKVLYDAITAYLRSRLGKTVEVAPANDLVALSEQIRAAEQKTSPADQISLSDQMLTQAYHSARQTRDERLRQASLTFNAALILAIMGTLFVLAGLAIIFLTPNKTAGGIGALAGVVSNVISAISFRLNRETNDRLDQANVQVATIEASQVAVQVAMRMESGISRDETFREIALRVIQAPPARKRLSH